MNFWLQKTKSNYDLWDETKIYNEERVLFSFFKGVVLCQILLTKIFTASVNNGNLYTYISKHAY